MIVFKRTRLISCTMGANDTLLYSSLCWNDQHKEPMIDTNIIEMGNELANDNRNIII